VPSELFSKWLESRSSSSTAISYFVEKKDDQQAGLDLLKPLMADHFVGEATVLKLGGYDKSAETLRNSLPTNKRTQSGDMGELLATEYVNSQTEFTAPINYQGDWFARGQHFDTQDWKVSEMRVEITCPDFDPASLG
jgi:hypothetical protein